MPAAATLNAEVPDPAAAGAAANVGCASLLLTHRVAPQALLIIVRLDAESMYRYLYIAIYNLRSDWRTQAHDRAETDTWLIQV